MTHHCPWGVAVIAGTGSVVICLEVDEKGQVSQIGRRGGTGYLLGDDGSGKLIPLVSRLKLMFSVRSRSTCYSIRF